MKNLEKQIINRLNKVLNKYNLEIISKINHNYKITNVIDDKLKRYCNTYVLVEINHNTIIECYFTWDNIESMLLDSAFDFSIFNSINVVHKRIKQYNDFGIEPYECYILIDKLYNKLYSLNGCSYLEELAIKMDLMGI
jgi:hypothetical protein